MSDAFNLVLTRGSGVGKSTLLKMVGLALEGRRVRGFYSDVLFERSKRTDWRLDAFDGGVLYVHRCGVSQAPGLNTLHRRRLSQGRANAIGR